MDVDGLAAVPLLRTLPRARLESLAGQLPRRRARRPGGRPRR
ncbi:MAG TPA: hypothetical protein VEZ46_08615 [Mycobacteriales bacterium]|jgi:hypothetical protein|nr:hypothetical protein [Mycobacteriales bacterium]